VQRYQAIAMSDALRDSSQKPTGGGMSEGFGIAAGFMMGQTQAGSQQQPPTPPKTAQAKEILWYFASEGQKKGPYGDEAMRVQIENGRITRETLVWCQGMQNWTPAGNCPELKFFFEESPPPLPPG
jgi:membrane protease subunit (stomatin/prohibitin family)